MRCHRTRLLLLVLLAVSATACSTYQIAITPEPLALQARAPGARPPLTISVQSTYAPFVDGALSTDRYPRDRRIGREECARYRRAFDATGQFAGVQAAETSDGLHCQLTIVSGREPSHEFRRIVSILLTLTLLPHEQREIVRLEAKVSAPSRAPATYVLEALITTDARAADDARLRRPLSFSGPEHELVAALVARMAKDGWLDRQRGGQ